MTRTRPDNRDSAHVMKKLVLNRFAWGATLALPAILAAMPAWAEDAKVDAGDTA